MSFVPSCPSPAIPTAYKSAVRCSLSNSYTIEQICHRPNYQKQGFPECPLEWVTAGLLPQHLDTDMLVSLSDGRVLSGRLKGTDRHLNLILDGTQELLLGATRGIGMVVVPGSCITSIKRCAKQLSMHDVL